MREVIVTVVETTLLPFLLFFFLSVKYDNYRLKKQLREHRKAMLKLLLTSKTLPAQERSAAYTEYRSLGGNSWVDSYFKTKVQPLIDKEMAAIEE